MVMAIRRLYCFMNDEPVGELSRHNGKQSFRYDHRWLASPRGRALSVSLPLTDEIRSGDVVDAWFENLLPDNDTIRQAIVDRLGAASSKPFDLLTVLGRDCVGALTLQSNSEPSTSAAMATQPLEESEIEQLINDTRLHNILGMRAGDPFRLSLAGAQEKTALTWWQQRWQKPLGRTPTTHIFKPPISPRRGDPLDLSSSVDNEWFCLRYLTALGLPAAEAEIARFGAQKVLIVKRFDRRIIGERIYRLPQEDFCQALGKASGSKYESHGGPDARAIAGVLRYALDPEKDLEIFFKTQFVFWLLAAIDGHAKNFSLHHLPQGYSLTPLYDVMSTYPYFGQGDIQPQKIQMAMSVRGKSGKHYRWQSILPRHWMTHARHQGISQQLTRQWIDEVIIRTPESLSIALRDAPDEFDRQTGEAICRGTLDTLSKYQRLNGAG
ncbi:type II toxin-antitoxin system HipA family toxin [Erwinia sp. J316]|uniref:Type II toxin-antitoxin system HipA family toxin n=2 Tax=Erwinia sorbitola TaxID=2681984 RepID=A0ABW9RGK6_9GAMM|nr:type II toxin-antitoxin system HipA family toxin [Erwinia sorbitola]